MTLLETVQRLHEMEQTAKGKDLYSNEMDKYIDNAIFHVPAMLDVLSRFQKGDAKLLTDLIYIEEESAKFWAGFGKIPAPMQEIINMLKRLREGARRMEE